MEEWADKVRGLLRGGQGEMDSNDGRDVRTVVSVWPAVPWLTFLYHRPSGERRRTPTFPAEPLLTAAGYMTISLPFPHTQADFLTPCLQLTTPLSDIRSISQLVSSISQLDMPSQAGSILHAVPGTVKTESVRGEEHRVKAWAFLSTCAFDGDRELHADGAREGILTCETDHSNPFTAEYVGRLTAWTTSMLKRDLYELDETAETEARVEDLLCRVRELCEMGGVSGEHMCGTLMPVR